MLIDLDDDLVDRIQKHRSGVELCEHNTLAEMILAEIYHGIDNAMYHRHPAALGLYPSESGVRRSETRYRRTSRIVGED